jgi:hypothetical protein
MEVLDKRIVNRLQEDELTHYEEELLKHLPDCDEKAERVDCELLLSQIPSRNNPAALPEDVREDSQEESQEHVG